MVDGVLIGASGGAQITQPGRMSNRHGLIAGATGTGKTVSLQVLAEGFSRLGTPVFAVDVKGDLSGISQAGRPHREIDRRREIIGIEAYQQRSFPAVFFDVHGEHGHPVRTTICEMGPLILANLLELNEVQSGILYAAFAIADDEGLLLLDLKDLKAMLVWMTEHRSELRGTYGNIASASIGAIQRRLLVLESQGADRFFGEPALRLADLMKHDFSGNGVVSLLRGDRLIREAPRLYAAFLLWLLSELFEELPEVGDPPVPHLVMFFDEAHLLFKGAPKALLEKMEQVMRLIRSKGVGVYFVTQSPRDLPDAVLGQLGLKVQHALRAFTPNDQKTIKAVVNGFRSDGTFDVAATLTEMGVGEALVSTLEASGAPSVVRRTLLAPPESRIGPADDAERAASISRSPLGGRYDEPVDRESAHELLGERARAAPVAAAEAEAAAARAAEATDRARGGSRRNGSRGRQSVGEALLKSAARSVGSSLGRRLMRGLLGSLRR